METLPPPPALTVEQAADLRCLGLARIAESQNGGFRPMVKIYLDRLRESDPARDWEALAPTFSPDMTYGDFMGEMNTCTDRTSRRPAHPAPRDE